MKKIFAVILASVLMVFVVSCDGNKNTDKSITNIDQPADNSEDFSNIQSSNTGKLVAISSGAFSKIVSYSMVPYRSEIAVEKNMSEALTCFNGKVELTHYYFDTAEDASSYMDELEAQFPGEKLEFNNEGLKCFKKQDGSNVYMAVCIDETILFGYSRNGFEELNEWFYGIGYLAEK